MRFFKALLLLVGVLAAIFLVGGMIVPNTWTVRRSTIIAAPPEAIYPHISEFKKWNDWAPWGTDKDPTLAYTYEGPESGPGAMQRWTSKKMGTGWMKIKESSPEKGLTYTLFIDMGGFQSELEGELTLTPVNGMATQVTWTDHGDAGKDLRKKWMNILMDPMLGKEFEVGLAKLRKLVEN